MRHRLTAHEAERLTRLRAPVWHPGVARQVLDNARFRRFLEHDHVRRRRADDGGQRRLTAAATVADVVRQQSERHAPSVFSINVKYAWPSTSPRKCITNSRDA